MTEPLPIDFEDGIGMKADAAYLNLVGTKVNALVDARPITGTYVERPAAGETGRVFYATDLGTVYLDDGAEWVLVLATSTPPWVRPPTTGWDTTTMHAATVGADRDGRLMTLPGSDTSPNAGRVEFRTLSPAMEYVFTVYLEFAYYDLGGSPYGGMFLRNSTSGNTMFFGWQFNTGGGSPLYIARGTPTNMVSVVVHQQSLMRMPESPRWMRIVDNGTHRQYYVSFNGIDWVFCFSETRTTHITADQVGWGGTNSSSNNTALLRLRHFNVEAL